MRSAVKITAKKRGEKRTNEKEDCPYHNAMEIFPVQYVARTRERKGKKEVLVHWLPCLSCKKIWPPSWEPQDNISLALTAT
ncbi:hypothetical protein SKAU_G00250030 [Synaphobranchus kaupii]|uniref:Chromo domain-containing protein n=1 Tax=Synaphobranchus kaupii TaxID=118154 RepID=A0A9Q1F2P2_SYNKA|nr:hypothetical protein SKAU_G00250030 [Synaphobranchus kaupii]